MNWSFLIMALVTFAISMYLYVHMQQFVKYPGKHPFLEVMFAFFRPKTIFPKKNLKKGYKLLLFWGLTAISFLMFGTLVFFNL